MAEPYLDEPDEDEGPPGRRWLTTWADMMAVLLTFFVVLQAFSTLNDRKFHEAMSSIQRAFQMPMPIRSPGSRIHEVPRTAERMQERLKMEGENGVVIEDYGDRLILSVGSELLFEIGRADLTPVGERVIGGVAKALAVANGPIRVEGHTCDLPVGSSSEFRDNWELSTGRALSVLHALIRRGVPPARLSAVGYGEFRPIAPNDTETNRRRNRRVEFVVEKALGEADRY